MIVPPAAQIEIAKDQLADPEYRQAHAWVWPDQLKELHEAKGDTSEDFQKGFELGLQTARVFLSMDPPAIQAKVTL